MQQKMAQDRHGILLFDNVLDIRELLKHLSL
jgi:hypothetical protein